MCCRIQLEHRTTVGSLVAPVVAGAIDVGIAISNGNDLLKTVVVALIGAGAALVAVLVSRFLIRWEPNGATHMTLRVPDGGMFLFDQT